MKNLTREYVKRHFFENKDYEIENYVRTMKPNISIYEYTKGKKVIIDNTSKKAYSKNGYLFEVILRDEDYINYLSEMQQEVILCYLDSVLGERYEEQKDEEVEEPSYEEEDE